MWSICVALVMAAAVPALRANPGLPDPARIATLKTSIEMTEGIVSSILESTTATEQKVIDAETLIAEFQGHTYPVTKRELELNHARIEALLQVVKLLEERIDAVNATHTEVRDQYVSLNSQLDASETRLTALMQDSSDLNAAQAAFDSQISSDASATNSQLTQDASDCVANLTSVNSEITSISSNLDDDHCITGVAASGIGTTTITISLPNSPTVLLSIVGFSHHLLQPYSYDLEDHPIFGSYVDVLGFSVTLVSSSTTQIVYQVSEEADSSVVAKTFYVKYTACY